MRKGDLVELSPRLANHGGRVVRVLEVERDFDGLNLVEWVVYADPDGAVGNDGVVLHWRVQSHLCIVARQQRKDYAQQDLEERERDRLRARADAALKMQLQRLGLVRVPRARRGSRST